MIKVALLYFKYDNKKFLSVLVLFWVMFGTVSLTLVSLCFYSGIEHVNVLLVLGWIIPISFDLSPRLSNSHHKFFLM